MKIKHLVITLSMLIGVMVINVAKSVAQTKNDAITGEWLSQKKDVRFLIFRQNDKYFGKVLWGSGRDTVDTKNPDGRLRSRKLVGAILLKDFVFDGTDTWQDGTIYDPADGNTYACKLSLTNDKKLKVRGYVGISLFGRTEYWTRIKN